MLSDYTGQLITGRVRATKKVPQTSPYVSYVWGREGGSSENPTPPCLYGPVPC